MRYVQEFRLGLTQMTNLNAFSKVFKGIPYVFHNDFEILKEFIPGYTQGVIIILRWKFLLQFTHMFQCFFFQDSIKFFLSCLQEFFLGFHQNFFLGFLKFFLGFHQDFPPRFSKEFPP